MYSLILGRESQSGTPEIGQGTAQSSGNGHPMRGHTKGIADRAAGQLRRRDGPAVVQKRRTGVPDPDQWRRKKDRDLGSVGDPDLRKDQNKKKIFCEMEKEWLFDFLFKMVEWLFGMICV